MKASDGLSKLCFLLGYNGQEGEFDELERFIRNEPALIKIYFDELAKIDAEYEAKVELPRKQIAQAATNRRKRADSFTEEFRREHLRAKFATVWLSMR